MSGLETRIAKLHNQAIGDVSTQIIVMKGETILREVWRGANKQKVIRIVVRL